VSELDGPVRKDESSEKDPEENEEIATSYPLCHESLAINIILSFLDTYNIFVNTTRLLAGFPVTQVINIFPVRFP
jgi:hypothetical protein